MTENGDSGMKHIFEGHISLSVPFPGSTLLERRVWFRRRFLYSRGGHTASLI
jgi:hypothetical protein